jgi:DNA-binding transcriptional ArsR family regulator
MLIDELKRYLRETIGEEVKITPIEKVLLRKIPFYLKQVYGFYQVWLFNKESVLMANKGGEYTPAEIDKQRAAVRESLGVIPIYVNETLSAFNRKRLIERKIPFIITGKQMYLPMLMIDLRERFDSPRAKPERISMPGQVILLSYLLHGSFNGKTPGEMAKSIKYSPMSLTRAVKELSDLGLCTARRQGREKIVYFPENKSGLWQKSLPFLSSPIKEQKETVLKGKPGEKFLLSGLNALAEYSMISAGEVPAYAIHSSIFNVLKTNQEVEWRGEEVILESWAYDPALVSKTRFVDPLSLFLCFRDSADERVESALEQLIKGMPW